MKTRFKVLASAATAVLAVGFAPLGPSGPSPDKWGEGVHGTALARVATMFESASALNVNLLGEVPLSASTNTRVQPSLIGQQSIPANLPGDKNLDDQAIRDLVDFLNRPGNFTALAATGAFEPHVAFVFRDAAKASVLKIEVSFLNNCIKTSPRLASFTHNQLSETGRAKLQSLARRLNLVVVDAAYASRFVPNRLTDAQKASLLPLALNPELFRPAPADTFALANATPSPATPALAPPARPAPAQPAAAQPAAAQPAQPAPAQPAAAQPAPAQPAPAQPAAAQPAATRADQRNDAAFQEDLGEAELELEQALDADEDAGFDATASTEVDVNLDEFEAASDDLDIGDDLGEMDMDDADAGMDDFEDMDMDMDFDF